MKFEQLNFVSLSYESRGDGKIWRINPLHLSYGRDGLYRCFAVFIFDVGYQLTWSVKCKCNACRISRVRRLLEWFGLSLTDDEIVNNIPEVRRQPCAMREALTQHRYREAKRKE